MPRFDPKTIISGSNCLKKCKILMNAFLMIKNTAGLVYRLVHYLTLAFFLPSLN